MCPPIVFPFNMCVLNMFSRMCLLNMCCFNMCWLNFFFPICVFVSTCVLTYVKSIVIDYNIVSSIITYYTIIYIQLCATMCMCATRLHCPTIMYAASVYQHCALVPKLISWGFTCLMDKNLIPCARYDLTCYNCCSALTLHVRVYAAPPAIQFLNLSQWELRRRRRNK